MRTLFLLLGFGWFTDQSARFGDVVLAANHVLLQLVSFSAFFLDGFAFVAESLVGNAVGARRRADFDTAVRRSTELAAVTAIGLAAAILLLGPPAIRALTDLPGVRAVALDHAWARRRLRLRFLRRVPARRHLRRSHAHSGHAQRFHSFFLSLPSSRRRSRWSVSTGIAASGSPSSPTW